MNKQKIILLSILFFSIAMVAQPGRFKEKIQEKKEQIKAMKIGYITDELQLTTKEAENFWPLFNAFESAQSNIRKNKYKNFIGKINIDNVTDKEAAVVLKQIEDAEDELYQLQKKFNSDLKSIIPASKILKLKKSEESFNKKLLNELRKKRS